MNVMTNGYIRTKDSMTRCGRENGAMAFRKSAGYCASADLARIAAACNIQEVKSVSRFVEFKMARVKKSGASKSEIKASLRQMEKVLGKAKKKVAGLKKEEQLKELEKRAAEAQKEKLRRRRREEYLEHKRKREAKERNDAAAPFPAASEGARQIAEEAYRRAMENMSHSYPDRVPEGSMVDVSVDDTILVDGCSAVDVAGAAVDMEL